MIIFNLGGGVYFFCAYITRLKVFCTNKKMKPPKFRDKLIQSQPVFLCFTRLFKPHYKALSLLLLRFTLRSIYDLYFIVVIYLFLRTGLDSCKGQGKSRERRSKCSDAS